MNVQGLATVLTSDDMLRWLRDLCTIVRDRGPRAKAGRDPDCSRRRPITRMSSTSSTRCCPTRRSCSWSAIPRRGPVDAPCQRGTVGSLGVHGGGRGNRSVAAQRTRAARAPRRRTHAHGPLRGSARGRRAARARLPHFLDLGDPSEWMKSSVDASPGERRSTVVAGEAAAEGLASYELTGILVSRSRPTARFTQIRNCVRRVPLPRRDARTRLLGRFGAPAGCIRCRRSVRFARLRAWHYWRRSPRGESTPRLSRFTRR